MFLVSSLPCRSTLLGSQCRWLRSDRGWGCTHPPAPHSSCQCSPPGSGSSGCSQHPDTGLSYDTEQLPPHLEAGGQREEEHAVKCLCYRCEVDTNTTKKHIQPHTCRRSHTHTHTHNASFNCFFSLGRIGVGSSINTVINLEQTNYFSEEKNIQTAVSVPHQ